MRKKQLFQKCISLFLSSAMVASILPAAAANAAEVKTSPFLTDANGVPRAVVEKVASDNHEIIDIRMPDNETHKVTIYLLDEDNSGRWSMVDVIDPDTQKLLDSQNVYDFSEGVYLSWNISGHLQIRLTNVWTKRYMDSKDTAVHGIFIDGQDAVKDGRAVVTTEDPGEDTAANGFEGINVLGRYAAAGQEFQMPFDKEVQSVELRFNGNIDPSSENLDKIQVRKDGNPVEGEMRSSFHSVTFVPSETLKDGNYTVNIPAGVKNSAGKELGKETAASFEVKTKLEVVYFREGLNYMTRRVDLTFNDRLVSASDGTLVYKGGGADRQLRLVKGGNHGGLMFEVQDRILPSGTYHFTLAGGTESVSGAVCEGYEKDFVFDSSQLSAKIDAPTGVEKDQPALLEVGECFGYGEMRYAFSEEDLAAAAYEPVKEEVEVPTTGLSGEQTLYVQFRVKEGEKQGQESSVLHKAIYLGLAKKGQLLPFDMETAGAYDKDGFGSLANPKDGVFDLATDTWTEGLGGTSNYIADGENGVEGLYDPDKDAAITTKKRIPYQLSKNIYVDGKPNVATGNGKEIPAPSESAYEKIYVLAAGKYDDNKGTFTMNYTDGTSTEEEINAHYWESSAHQENIVFDQISACLGWANNYISNSGVMRQYELKPDNTKNLQSITLPDTDNLIRVFAITGKEMDIFDTEKLGNEDVLSYSEGEVKKTEEESDPTYDEFIQAYGDDAELREAADVTDVTNIQEVPAGERTYDEEIMAELSEKTGDYGQGLYPYVRQPEKLMSYKIRMQIYDDYELNAEDALEAIRRVDNLSRGLEKKCYLVGWQTNGHDTGFPYIGEVNPRHKRPMDDTAVDSLKWLMKEAKKYHTTITLHVNFSDAYADDDPLSQSMIEKQIPIREKDGKVRETLVWAGHKGFMVSAYGNYFTGNWQKNQIDPLIAMFPDLEGQSVHPDAWYSHNDPYYDLTTFDTADAQRRHAKYMREKYNMDLTTEFEFQFGGGQGADHVLYFPMIWQGGWTDNYPLQIPSYFQSTVNQLTYDGRLTAAGRYFGEGSAVEPNLWSGYYGNVTMPGLKASFAEKELTRQYFNTLLRTSMADDPSTGGTAELRSGEGQQITSAWNGDDSNSYKRTVTVGDDVVLQEPGSVFMPMTWRPGLEIQAWSREGYTEKSWKLPVEWEEVDAVDLYDASLEGLRYIKRIDADNRTVSMTLGEDQTVIVVPAGNNPNSTKGFEQNGSVQFLGRDSKTGGNWTKTYGKEGYDLFEEESHIPANIQISYVNGTKKTVETDYVEVESLELSQNEADLDEGGTLKLEAKVNPDTATDKTVIWSSSDSDIASVEDGTVTAMKEGTATITARAGKAEAFCKITVKGSSENQEKTDAAKVEALIHKIGTVTADSKADIEAARRAYNALSDGAKKLVTNLGVLEAAEKRLDEILNPPVSAKIDIAKAAIKTIPTQLYSGKALTPALDITYGGNKLVINKDYKAVYSGNKNIGTAKVQINGIGSYTGSITRSFKIKVKKNAVYTVGNYKYKITNASTNGKGSIALIGVKSKSAGNKLKKVTVAGTVKIGGIKFYVAEIGSKAFSGCKNVSSVSVGTNVTKIGTSAFYNCKKLTKVTISSKKLKSVGKNALKNISPKAKIKVPKSKQKAYKKLLKGKGQKKTVTITS